MTETLGWGDVDVDEAPRRRRRLPFVLVWVVVAAVVAGIAIWPTAKSALADRAAAWLQRQWQAGGDYESSRVGIEAAAAQRVAAGDTAIMVRIVQTLDREEAAKLTALATAIGRHRTWVAGVDAAGKAVRKAFLAQSHDLRADVAAAPKQVPAFTSVETPYSSATEVLLVRAGNQIQRMLHNKKVKTEAKHQAAALTSAADEVEDLSRVTATPVDLRLAVMYDAQLDVWDLRTGQVRRNVIGNLPVDPPDTLHVMGSSLLATYEDNAQIWPTAGTSTISLPTTSPTDSYQANGADGLWRSHEGSIRRYDATGHPVGPWHRYPAGMETDPMGATEDAVVSNLGPMDFNDPHPVLWYPDSGRVVPLDDPCPGIFDTTGRTVAFVSCDQTTVHLFDTHTGRANTVRVPRGLSLEGREPVLSPDGTKMALLAGPQGSDDERPSLYIFDLTTSAVTHLDTIAGPVTWSPDGSVLLLDVNGDGMAPSTTTESSLPLAYWTPGMTALAGIRINLNDGSYFVGALP